MTETICILTLKKIKMMWFWSEFGYYQYWRMVVLHPNSIISKNKKNLKLKFGGVTYQHIIYNRFHSIYYIIMYKMT